MTDSIQILRDFLYTFECDSSLFDSYLGSDFLRSLLENSFLKKLQRLDSSLCEKGILYLETFPSIQRVQPYQFYYFIGVYSLFFYFHERKWNVVVNYEMIWLSKKSSSFFVLDTGDLMRTEV